MARALWGLKRLVEAEDLAGLVCNAASDEFGKRNPFTLQADRLVTDILVSRNWHMAYERAPKLLQLHIKVLGDDHLDTQETRLLFALSNGGLQQRAEILRDVYLENRKMLGEEHEMTIGDLQLWLNICRSSMSVQYLVDRYPTDRDKKK
jgi:hypothetical protein